MKKIILFCAVFFLSFSLLNAQTTEVEKWTIRGDEYYDAKDYQNAIKAYTQVEESNIEKVANDSKDDKDGFVFAVGKCEDGLVSLLDLNAVALEKE